MADSTALSQLLHAALEPRVNHLRELAEAESWQEDPEALHQVRVASRRVRAVLDLMDPEAYPGLQRQQRHLRQLTRTLGLTRELDVHVDLLESLQKNVVEPLHQAALEFLLEHLDRRRRKARKAMARRLGRTVEKAVSSLPETSGGAEAPWAGALSATVWSGLEPRLLAVDHALPELLDREEVPRLHELRIHVKRLRYTLEVLEPAFPQPPEELLQTLKALQAELGSHHDHALLEAHLRERQDALAGRGRATLANAMLALLDRIDQGRGRHYARFCALGRAYLAEAPFQSLRKTVEAPGSGTA